MKKEILLYFALLLWFVVPAEAQLTIFASDAEATAGDSIEMEFRATDFDSILSIQYSLNWDSTVIRFKSVTVTDQLSAFRGTNPNSGNHGSFANTKPGILRMLWATATALGESIPDSTLLFTLKFDVVGQPDSSTVVDFTDTPIVKEVLGTRDGKSSTLQPVYKPGTVTVRGMGTPTYSPVTFNGTLYQNEPNPFKHFTFVKFELLKADNIEFQIYDLKGQLIYSMREKYTGGVHQIKLDARIFPASGTYLYRLGTANGTLTKKLIVIQ